jgi:hypothetical protein
VFAWEVALAVRLIATGFTLSAHDIPAVESDAALSAA